MIHLAWIEFIHVQTLCSRWSYNIGAYDGTEWCIGNAKKLLKNTVILMVAGAPTGFVKRHKKYFSTSSRSFDH